jgi:hypothetical protein
MGLSAKLLVLVAGSLCAPAAFAQALPITPVVVTGDPVPGLPGATFGTALGAPTIAENSGVVSFSATIQGAGITVDNDQGQWRSGPLGALIRENDTAPWAATTFALGTFSLPALVINNSLQPLLTTRLQGTGVTTLNDKCVVLLRGPAQSPLPVIREGDQALGLPAGITYGDGQTTTPSNAAPFSLVTSLRGTGVTTGSDTAIWVGSRNTPATLAFLAREGATAPGLGAGATFGASILGSPVWINSLGTVAFLANVDLIAVPTTVLYRGTPGALVPIVRTNTQVPGLPAGVTFQSFGAFNLTQNDIGTITFSATIAGNGVTPVNNTGIWVVSGGVSSLLARAGQQVPGLPAGVAFDRLADWCPIVTSTDSIYFLTRLAGPGVSTANDTALLVFSGGQFRVAAREGDTIPGLPSNVFLGEFSTTIYPQVNNRGQCVIQASLTGAVATGNDSAIVGWDSVAGPIVVYREGEPLLIRGNLWTDSTFVMAQTVAVSYNGRGVVLDENGQVAFAILRPAGGPSAIVTATIPSGPTCDSVDFNRDTLTPDSGDLDDFIAVLAGGPPACSNFPNCGDIDFNNDGLEPDSTDLDAFISRLGGGPCLVP